jgi:uncharacterized protein
MTTAWVGDVLNVLRVDGRERRDETTRTAKVALAVLCLLAAFAYRASVSLVPSGLVEGGFLIGLAALFLGVAVVFRRNEKIARYWQIPFAFFVFTIAGFAADLNVSPLQRLFVHDVLHQAPTANNPLASSVLGTVLAQIFGTVCIVVPIVALVRASGAGLASIFISPSKSWGIVLIGFLGLVAFYYLTARGRTAAFFPHTAVSPSRFLALTPALIVLVLLNGLREELWFRGLFLQRYGGFFGPWTSNVLTAVVFTSFHVQVQYALHLLPFLAFTFVLGLFCGYLMQRSGSLIGPVLFHAGSDIPIFLVYVASVSS